MALSIFQVGISRTVLQLDIVRDDVLVIPVLEQKALGNHAELGKAEFLVELEGRGIRRDDRVELQDPEADFLCLREAILHEEFADVLAALVLLDCVARV